MYPRFAHDYMNYVKAHGTRTTKQLQGFGGQANVAAWRLAELPIEIGGTTDNLHQIDALVDYTDELARVFRAHHAFTGTCPR